MQSHEMHSELTQTEHISFTGGQMCFGPASNSGQKLPDKTECATRCQRNGIQSIWRTNSWIQFVYYEVRRNASVKEPGFLSAHQDSELPCSSGDIKFSIKPWKQKLQWQCSSLVHRGKLGALKYWLKLGIKASNILARHQGTQKSQSGFFTCSMSQGKPLGWSTPLTAWLCYQQR